MVDQESDDRIYNSLYKGKRHIYDNKRLGECVDITDYCVISGDNIIHTAECKRVCGISYKIIHKEADYRCHNGTDDGSRKRAAARMMFFIDNSRRYDQRGTEKKICKFADAGGRGKREMDGVFDKLNDRAVNGAERKRGKICRQI